MFKNYSIFKTIIIFTIFIICLSLQVTFAYEANHCDCCTCHKGSRLPVEIKNGTVLSIQDCISIGLKNSPIIKKHKYELDVAKSNVGLAKSVYFPKLNAGAGFGQVHNSNNTEFNSIYRELPNIGVSLRQMIWDFGRSNAHIRMEEFYKIGAEYEFMDSVCSTVFDIKTKYYGVLRAKSILEVKKSDFDINAKIISDIKDMIKIGRASRADLINAETEQLKIKNEIIEAEDNLKNSIENLNNSMYFLDAPVYQLAETDTYKYFNESNSPYKFVSYTIGPKTLKIQTSKNDLFAFHPSFAYAEAVDLAYKNSPDLKVLESTKNAMEQALLIVKRSYYPELSASVGYGRLNTNHFNNNEFAFGVNLSADLNAMELKYGLRGARAQISLAETEIDKYKKDLYFKVRKALNRVNMAKEQIPVAIEQLNTSSENFNLTYDRYKNEKMNQLELLYARNSYIDSMENYVNAVYVYNLSLIDLEIAMHYHLIDIHDRAKHAIDYHENEIIDNFNDIMDCDKHDK